MSKSRNIRSTRGVLVPCALLAACANDVIDLGSNGVVQRLELGSRCVDSPIATGPIEIYDQEELDGLRGCEEVRGNLQIYVYDDTDLRPLSSLRAVTGRFIVGFSPENYTEETVEAWRAEEAERERIVAAGWLPSLEGLEALERVGSLELKGIAAADLRAFSNLRNLASGDDPSSVGVLAIWGAKNLVDLQGLENARGIAEVELYDIPLLESLTGLTLTASFDGDVNLADCPLLTDVSALEPLESFEFLTITNTGIQNLDPFDGWLSIRYIQIEDNLALTDLSGLGQGSFARLWVEGNPKLVTIPEFINGMSQSEIRVADNASLENLFLSFQTAIAQISHEERSYYIGKDWIDISDNPKLRTITIFEHEEESSSHLGLLSGQLFRAQRNSSLQRIDFGSFRQLDILIIGNNPELAEVRLGDLERVDEIAVTANPKLITAELRALPTYLGTFSGNADDASGE